MSSSRTTPFALAAIMSTRMLGLFMILPVFSVYATHFAHATPTLMGVTLGIYGLTQAIFQIPFGALSDHFGRKKIILLGLCLLLVGSVVCAISTSIYFLLLGRALQGAGAIGSTILALLADLTRDESRTKAMALIGLSIGLAFTTAMIVGPMINHWFHLSGIFWVTALLAIGAMGLLLIIPTPPKPLKRSSKSFASVFHNTQLLRCNASIFCLHAILTAVFIAIPIVLTRDMQLSEPHQIILYFCVLVFSFLFAVPFIIISEKKRKIKLMMIGAIAAILCVQIGLVFFHHDIKTTAFLLFIFFTALTLLEATLPSLVSKIAPIHNKGAAMGVYSSSQFFGIFVGGALGGWVFSQANLSGVFAFCAVISAVFLLIAFLMQQPA